MENCVVTKLAGSSDGNLPRKYDVFKLHISTVDNWTYLNGRMAISKIDNTKPLKIKVIGSGSFSIGDDTSGTGNTEAVMSDPKITFGNGDYDVEITPQYNVGNISVLGNTSQKKTMSFDMGLLDYNEVTSIDISGMTGVYGNYNPVNPNILTQIIFNADYWYNRNSELSFDLSHLSENNIITRISGNVISKMTGSIESLAKCVSLTRLDFHLSSSVIGDIKNFAIAQVAQGRTSGSVELRVVDSGITYTDGNGVAHKITDAYIAQMAGHASNLITVNYSNSYTGGYQIVWG